MFDINPDQLVSKNDKLLYNIWQELKRLNTPVRPTREDTGAAKKPKPAAKSMIRCKKCPATFTNRGEFFQHAKQHKKEGK